MSNVRLLCRSREWLPGGPTLLNIDPHDNCPAYNRVDILKSMDACHSYKYKLWCCETRNSKLVLMSTHPHEAVIYDPFTEEVVCRSVPNGELSMKSSGVLFPVLKGPDSGIIFYDKPSPKFLYMTCRGKFDQPVYIANKPLELRCLCCYANEQGVTESVILTTDAPGCLHRFDMVKCRIVPIIKIWGHMLDRQVADFIDCNTFVMCSKRYCSFRGTWLIDKRCNVPMCQVLRHSSHCYVRTDLYNPHQFCTLSCPLKAVSIWDIRKITNCNSVHQVQIPREICKCSRTYQGYNMRQIGPTEFVFRGVWGGSILSTSCKRIEGKALSQSNGSIPNSSWAVAVRTDEPNANFILLVSERMLFSVELCAMMQIVYCCGKRIAAPRYFLL